VIGQLDHGGLESGHPRFLEQIQREEDVLGRAGPERLVQHGQAAGVVVAERLVVVREASLQRAHERRRVFVAGVSRHDRPAAEDGQHEPGEHDGVERHDLAEEQHQSAGQADGQGRDQRLDRDLRGQALVPAQRLVEDLERRVVDRMFEGLVDRLVRDHEPEDDAGPPRHESRATISAVQAT
jgi:hypothetical protein